jgi:hypothetical protein
MLSLSLGLFRFYHVRHVVLAEASRRRRRRGRKDLGATCHVAAHFLVRSTRTQRQMWVRF